jgi:hypothetical protein
MMLNLFAALEPMASPLILDDDEQKPLLGWH